MSLPESHVLSSFLGSRVELKCRAGEPPSYGWLVAGPTNVVTIKLVSEPNFSVGDSIDLQLSCKTSSSKLSVVVLELKEGQAIFSLPHLIRIDPPLEIARKRPDIPVTCTFRSPDDGKDYSAEVIDIAPRGIGLRSEEPLDKDARVDFTVMTPTGPIYLTGTVVYCTQEEESLESHRIGLKIDRLLRVDKARWTQLLAA